MCFAIPKANEVLHCRPKVIGKRPGRNKEAGTPIRLQGNGGECSVLARIELNGDGTDLGICAFFVGLSCRFMGGTSLPLRCRSRDVQATSLMAYSVRLYPPDSRFQDLRSLQYAVFRQGMVSHFVHLVARVLFSIYFFLILFGCGRLGLILIRQSRLLFDLAPSEEIAVSVLLGSSILRAAMLILGLLSAYFWPLLLVLGVAALIVGMPRFAFLIRSSLMSSIRNWNGAMSAADKIIAASLIGALISAVVAVSLGKFLYPNGTGDYFTNYFPFNKEVVQAGNIWPNDVWYHFYMSKGFGEIFFAIILSDFLGPQAASQAMFILGLVIAYAMMKRMFDDEISGLSAAAIVAAGLIWTYEKNIGFGDWAEFPKQHLITAILFMGCVWIGWLQFHMEKLQMKGWGIVCASIYGGLVWFIRSFLCS